MSAMWVTEFPCGKNRHLVWNLPCPHASVVLNMKAKHVSAVQCVTATTEIKKIGFYFLQDAKNESLIQSPSFIEKKFVFKPKLTEIVKIVSKYS